MASLYLDTSAAVKLIVPDPESQPLLNFLREHSERLSSGLLRVEVQRALRRDPLRRPYWRERAAALLASLGLLDVTESVLVRAAELDPFELRSLEAIHLATALSVPGLADFVVYDRRLADAASYHGLRVWSPGRA